jgi:hypothetical protein
LALLELDVLDEMRELSPKEIFGGWLQELLVAFSPFIEPALAWLLEGLEIVISVKLDDIEKTFKMSESGLEIEDGLREDALVTMITGEKDFMSILRGERMMNIMPPSDEPIDILEFPEMVKEYVDAIKGIEAVLSLKVVDPYKGDLVAKVKFAGLMKDEPDVEVIIDQDVLEDMALGALDPAQAFLLSNVIEVEGDVNLLMKLAMMMM